MKKFLGAASMLSFLTCAVLTPATSNASGTSCIGRLTHIDVLWDGTVRFWTDYHSNVDTICNVTTTSNNVDPNTCLSWLSLAKTAQIQQKSISVYYDQYNDCSQANGTSSRPYYVELTTN